MDIMIQQHDSWILLFLFSLTSAQFSSNSATIVQSGHKNNEKVKFTERTSQAKTQFNCLECSNWPVQFLSCLRAV